MDNYDDKEIFQKLEEMIGQLEDGAELTSIDIPSACLFASMRDKLMACCNGVDSDPVVEADDKIWGGASVTIVCDFLETENVGRLFAEALECNALLTVAPAYEPDKINVRLTIPGVFGVAKKND